ncbi:CDGSH iron-sulfur domain-containing protein [Selenomonadales bacterium OttesenSCG-928-I06]|nr:CDGSH iron-sulfur domain-containing protein [Selenomonadales bacterium OttesenSCG-928-I06]
MAKDKKIRILPKGPYEISGDIPLKKCLVIPDAENRSDRWEDGKVYETAGEVYHLCRCGHSQNKPFCDYRHLDTGFEGKEVAKHEFYDDKAKLYKGPTIDLLDNSELCAVVRFCKNTWHLVKDSDNPESREQAIYEASACPAGRLIAVEKDGTKIEPELKQEIGVVQDVPKNHKGPLWVKGGITVEGSNGVYYEVRNRVTLCRCGESKNMPFCDGHHLSCKHMQGLDK